MGKCTQWECDIIKDNKCCLGCSAARIEECSGLEVLCPEIEEGTINSGNYKSCPYYEEDEERINDN